MVAGRSGANWLPVPAPAQWQDLAARMAKPRVDVPPKSLVPPVQDEHEDLAARRDNLHMDVAPKSLVPPAGAVSWQPSPFQARAAPSAHVVPKAGEMANCTAPAALAEHDIVAEGRD